MKQEINISGFVLVGKIKSIYSISSFILPLKTASFWVEEDATDLSVSRLA
jgi:hypothetical protein